MEKTILVVEDERPLAEAIRMKLEDEGFAVVTARTVEQALGYVKDIAQVHAIWLDHYLLGKEDGLDFVAKLKNSGEAIQRIPIFVVSNTVGQDKVQSYLHLGVNKYYIKAEHQLSEIIQAITEAVTDESKV